MGTIYTKEDLSNVLANVDYDRDYWFDTDTVLSFKESKDNRPSKDDEDAVKAYAKLMRAGKWVFSLSPIYVGVSTKAILNGEHRRKAIRLALAKGAIIPAVKIKFVDDKDERTRKQVVNILNSGKALRCADCCEREVKEGNKDFIELKKFCLNTDHPRLHTKGINWNLGGVLVCGNYKAFKAGYQNGDWEVSKKQWDRAEQTYNEVYRIRKALRLEDAGQDCWQYICEAWHRIINDRECWQEIQKLPNGIEDFYEELKSCDNTNSNKPQEWYNRLVGCINNAYQKRFDAA